MVVVVVVVVVGVVEVVVEAVVVDSVVVEAAVVEVVVVVVLFQLFGLQLCHQKKHGSASGAAEAARNVTTKSVKRINLIIIIRARYDLIAERN